MPPLRQNRRPWVALALLLTLTLPTLPATTAVAASPSDTTSALERARVDAIPTPTLRWKPCDLGECATVRLPLDYDDPRGAKIDVAVTRIPARKPAERIGSLFLNPGGPGASGTEFPLRAQSWLGPDVLDRFDLIGMDPRGTNASTRSACFGSTNRLHRVTGRLMGMGFPVTAAEERQFTKDARALATSCSGHGKQLASAMSTAQVARDMDVLRRAVGDERLTFLGFSYGTHLGQVYANLFPDRIRAVAIDGVVDPRAWVGSRATASVPISVRMGSAAASSAVLNEVLRRCADNPEACPVPDPEGTFARAADALRARPLVVEDPDLGPWELTYQGFVTVVLYSLYSEQGAAEVPFLAAMVDEMTRSTGVGPARRAQLAVAYRKGVERGTRSVRAYDNTVEQVPIVMCSDGRNPARASAWAALAEREDARAPYFGRHWLWGSVFCAGQHWRAIDEDAYTGPFNKVTVVPILVVGNAHDPATAYAAARDVAALIPRSRLLSSTNWGHTAYGVSACATAHVDRYLVDGVLPLEGTTCTDGAQPFEG